MNPPIPAATLVLMREGEGAPEILFAERTQTMAFAPGALVFPGGRIDAADRVLATSLGGGEARAAAIAAIRETLEETGIALGLSPLPDAETAAAMRTALLAEEPIGAVLARHGLMIETSALVPFARWCPDHRARRFDTHFFVARCPADAPEPTVHPGEHVRLFWETARGALDLAARGAAQVIFPTHCNLERLARFASFAEAQDDAAHHPVTTIVPWMEERGGRLHRVIPEGLGYPVTALPVQQRES